MKKSLFFLLFLLLLVSCAAAEAPQAYVESITKYGNLVLSIPGSAFLDMGYAFGDIVTVDLAGRMYEMPVCSDYSEVGQGELVCRVEIKPELGDDNVVLAINMGDLAASSGLAVREKIEADPGFIWHYTEGVPDPVPVLFSLSEKNGYQGSRLTRLLVRSQERADYPLLTDEEFANFRSVSTTGMRPMTLYRSSSPIDPVISRSREAAAAAEAAGIKTIINLSDTEEMMQEQPGYADSYYSRQNVLPLNLTIELSGEDFRAGFARAARFMLAHDGPYLIHCTHGKDRTGFICAILECLTGATLDEVVQDYMLTYGLFYNVIPMTEAYSIIAENNILAILSDAFETDDLLHLDLVSAAEDYLLNIGLTSDELSALRERLQS